MLPLRRREIRAIVNNARLRNEVLNGLHLSNSTLIFHFKADLRTICIILERAVMVCIQD